VVASFAAGTSAAGVRRSSHPRLDLAVDHITQAKALIDASDAGEVTAHDQRQFDKARARAQKALDDALEAIVDAQQVSNWVQ
jgi:hypothetical protein